MDRLAGFQFDLAGLATDGNLRAKRLVRRAFGAAVATVLLTGLSAPAEAAPRKHNKADAGTPVSKPAVEKAPSPVSRLAPDFTWEGPGGKAYSLKKLRGQPVVLLIGRSPNAGDVRQQAERIEKLYLQFSAKKVVFFAAFTAENGRLLVDIPFAYVQNGPGVAAAYGVTKGFAVAVIGPDGNLDLKADNVQGAQRILDIINNNFQQQAVQRAGLGG